MRTLIRLGLWLTLGGLVQAQEGALLPQASVDPPPGTYSSPVKITASGPPGASLRYRFAETSDTQTFPWPSSISLEALEGETRTTTLRLTTNLASGETLTRDYRYVVTGPRPPLAAVHPAPGSYASAIKIEPTLPPGWTLSAGGRPIASPVVLDATLGERKSLTLEARGPQGRSLRWDYEVDRRDQEVVSLDLISPISGSWANPQPLAAVFRGVDRVIWSYGTTTDPATAQVYTGPVILDRSGPQTITVAARSRSDGRWIQRSVSWSQGTEPAPERWPGSAALTQPFDLPEVPGAILSWDEGRSWQPALAARSETPASSRKVLAVQLKKTGSPLRFVYWLDARPPGRPDLRFVGGWNPRLLVTGASEAWYQVFWTLADGTVVQDDSILWGPVGSWKIPDHAVSARVVSHGVNSLEGQPAVLGFSETGWVVPEWEPWDQRGLPSDLESLPMGGRVLPRPGFWPVYEVADRPEVPEPGPGSPWLREAFLPMVPWGSDRTFYVRFAWRDAGGLVGPATPALAVRVDRVPPLAPDVVQLGGQVLVKSAEGEEEGATLTWAVTAHRAESADALTFQPYRTALDSLSLQAGTSGQLWIHAQALDRSANPGPARLNVALAPAEPLSASAVVQVDPDPAVGESPITDGGVYPWPQFRLRPLEQTRDLWVGVTDQFKTVPADWFSRVQPWTGILSRSVGQGERRTFLVFWNTKTEDGWAWPQPKTVTFTIDRGAPAVPVVAQPWPQRPLGEPWTLSLTPGRSGDRLRYTYSLDGSLPPDPAQAGEPWPGSRTWDAPSDGRVDVRVRIAAVSVAGQSLEVPLGAPVTIDRSPPPVVTPTLESFTYRAGAATIPLPPTAGSVRYSLTSDGSLPGAPSPDSPEVPSAGLTLEGSEGKSVLYRFRWRPFSASGFAGATTEVFTVLVDRTNSPEAGSGVIEESGTAAEAPHLSGYPSGGISHSAVTLAAEWTTGILRYEVREGLGGAPRSVTAQSPAWESSLVLDGGQGTDRSYAVGIRGFSKDGHPLTEEALYLIRVDRSIPAAPVYDLVADPRRAEAELRVQTGAANPDETLRYRWFWESYPQETGQIEWRDAPSGQVPLFSAPRGALTRWRVQAFWRDRAGNEGPMIEKTLLIDQNVVYVAPEATGDGTRSQPLGTMAEALRKARTEGRGVLFLAVGTYPVSKTLDLGGLEVYGGLDPRQWEATTEAGRSLWSAAAPFTGDSFLESGDRPWVLSQVDLSSGSVILPRMAVVRGAPVVVRRSAWSWSGALKVWDQTGGSLDWAEVTASYVAEPRGMFLDWNTVEASVRSLALSATQNQDGILFSLQESKVLLQDLTVVSKRGQGFEGVLSAIGGQLTVDRARILAGEGSTRATAFILKNSDTVFWNTELALYGTGSNTGFQTSGGRLELQKTTVGLLRGGEFNQGVVLDHTEGIFRSLQVKIESGSYQGGFTVDGGSITLSSSKVELTGGGNRVWGAQFLGSSSQVLIDNVSWVLATKTPGDLWKVEKPWTPGSTAVGSTTSGW